ncbi:MAG: SAM-dependent methyltransferase [Aeropyrum sp.]|nr:SAM-dependent methyltransferase [Aeropyrum sp.]MCE4616286.1 SAM-dependent methyltransferase [Aeropyrum sp.]
MPGQATEEALKAVSQCDLVYVETYTMPNTSWLLDSVARVTKGRVTPASREDLEAGSSEIVKLASKSSVAVVTAGDPLAATTHSSLYAEAARAGVRVYYIPGVSGVYTARSASMLSFYRFGGTVTVPGRWRGVKPLSVVHRIYLNLCSGLHTTVLLDVDESGEQLGLGEAASILLEADEEYSNTLGSRPLLRELPLIVVEAGGMGSHKVLYYPRLDEARTHRDKGVYTGIIPSRPSRVEDWLASSILGRFEYSFEAYSRIDEGCKKGLYLRAEV